MGIARDRIKDSLDLRDVMEYYGVEFNLRGYALCPFHSEKTASLSLKNGRFNCFGCGAKGDVIEFVMRYHNLKYGQALIRLDSDFQLGIIAAKQRTNKDYVMANEEKQMNDAIAVWKEDLRQHILTLIDTWRELYYYGLENGIDVSVKLDEIALEIELQEARLAWKPKR